MASVEWLSGNRQQDQLAPGTFAVVGLCPLSVTSQLLECLQQTVSLYPAMCWENIIVSPYVFQLVRGQKWGPSPCARQTTMVEGRGSLPKNLHCCTTWVTVPQRFYFQIFLSRVIAYGKYAPDQT